MGKIKSEAYCLVRKGTAEEAFELQSLELDLPEDKEVLIEVEAFGLNYADVMARKGLYKEAPDMPCVVGYEVVGVITHIGPNADQGLIGKRVVAFCRFGGYAKHVITWGHAVAVVEDQPAEELMALCTQGVTAYYMADYLTPIRSNEKVLIHAAAGGVGTILVQLAKLKGAEVFAKIGNENKTKLVQDLGADHVVNYRKSDYAQQLLGLLGDDKLDVSFNPVAGSTFKKDMAHLGAGGRMILFGGSELSNGKWGILSQLNFVRKMGLVIPIGLMMGSKNILGVNMLKIADQKSEVLTYCLNQIMKLYRGGEITPQVGGKYRANELAKAHEALEKGGTTGKLTVFW